MPAPQLDLRIKEFESLIEVLRMAGTRVAFVELPEHPEAYATPLKRQLSARMEEAFPANRYRWAPRSDPQQFATTDGVHLDDRSQRLFTERLRTWAATLPGWRAKQNRNEAVASHEMH